MNKDVSRENTTRIDHDYRVGDKVTTNMSSAYKYKSPLEARMKFSVHGQTGQSPYEQAWLHT